MEKQELVELVRNFDQYVRLSLENKPPNFPLPSQSHLDAYLRSMQKRLKLKPPTQQQKFEQLLSPMKSLKSFVSVKSFMENLGTRRKAKQEEAIRRQYEHVRGGFYFEKVESHLRNREYKRKIGSCLLNELEGNQDSEHSRWVEESLQKIGNKRESLFHKTTRNTHRPLSHQVGPHANPSPSQENCLIQQHHQTLNNFKMVAHIHQICSQQLHNFTKVSSLLTNRLRQLLKSNCALSSQKKPAKSRVSLLRRKDSQHGQLKRVQTAKCLQEESWRQSVHSKMRQILESEPNQAENH